MRESVKMLLHYITGVLILITGAIHVLSGHFEAYGLIKSAELYSINKLIFLASILYHALNGVRVVLIEFVPKRWFTDSITLVLIIIGLAFFIYTSLLIF
ncbi:MAG: hypothetical protein QXK95_03320 [Nitrososphaerota archaeon]|nr:hypothetical protein [Candidatus Geocrenenecus dongiae]